jgi:serine/threonine protein kinase
MVIAAGARFDRDEILSLLGKGGMGEVYLAQDTRLGRKIALKLLPPQFTADEDRVRRFEQEARAASALNRPNIITIYEIGEVSGTHFIADALALLFDRHYRLVLSVASKILRDPGEDQDQPRTLKLSKNNHSTNCLWSYRLLTLLK